MPTATGNTSAIRASEVIGADLYNSTGEKIGKIEDIILEKTSNRTMFAVVSVGGAVIRLILITRFPGRYSTIMM